MTPLDIITLESAKDWLVVDYDDRDSEITLHIKSAISLVETYTNHMLWNRSKSYVLNGYCLEVYDYPITVTTTNVTVKNRVLSVVVTGSKDQAIAASVGYASVDEVPPQLIQACYKMITYFFENKDVYFADLPADVQGLINQLRRSPTIL